MKKADFRNVETKLLNTLEGLEDKTITTGEAKAKAQVANAILKAWSLEVRFAEMMSNPDSRNEYNDFQETAEEILVKEN